MRVPPDQREARDLHTGELKVQDAVPLRLITPGHHFRCYRAKATERFIIMGKRGVEMVDLCGDNHSRNNWVRGTCQYGVMPGLSLPWIRKTAKYAGSTSPVAAWHKGGFSQYHLEDQQKPAPYRADQPTGLMLVHNEHTVWGVRVAARYLRERRTSFSSTSRAARLIACWSRGAARSRISRR